VDDEREQFGPVTPHPQARPGAFEVPLFSSG
jgi:hypothetical protein